MLRFRHIRLKIPLLLTLLLVTPAFAAPHEVRIRLQEGKLCVADLAAVVHVPSLGLGDKDVDLNGWRGSLFLSAINASLGDGCNVQVSDDVLLLHFDSEKLPKTFDDKKHALRIFVATETPEATAAQARRWGLFLPAHVDPARPLVILTHGLDCGLPMMQPMGDLLGQNGFQVAYFCYPNDQALDDSARFFGEKMSGLRELFPGIRVDIVAHSMGGLVCRDYVEGERYGGEVNRLILVGTPNNGSKWAKYHLALKAQEEFNEWRCDPEWHASWMFTDGLGEAARDLKPRSKFLNELNALPRRQGVAYTIIAGSFHPAARLGANWTEALASVIPDRARQWYVLWPIRRGLSHEAEKLRGETGKSDGPVTVDSCRLAGVSDFVTLHADHASLFCPVDGAPPVAFGVIADRLRH